MKKVNQTNETNIPMYSDHALYTHDHMIKENQTTYIGSLKKHLGKNHNKKALRVLVNGVYENVPL